MGRRRSGTATRGSNNGIATPERHKESGDKRNLTTASRETKRNREHEAAGTRPEAILGKNGAEKPNLVSYTERPLWHGVETKGKEEANRIVNGY